MSLLHLLNRLLPLILLFILIAHTKAYIPAIPVNDTTGLNLSDASSVLLRYAPNGVYGVEVSSQLTADVPTGGVDMGALVHFSESSQGPNLTTSTPWIAFISCDRNETNASQLDDIFTLVRDRGAVAALLYSLTAEACLLNPDYIDNFEKPVDVFATKSKVTAELIENQFPNTNQTYWAYNGTLLNESAAIVNQSLDASYIPTKTFLIATLTARNSSGSIISQPTPSASPTSSSTSTPKGKSLAMIILYCIVGIVVTLFMIVVLMGAIRALRHPERYGPRANEAEGRPPQTSVQGIGHAILDTFPVIKFTRGSTNGPTRRTAMPYPTFDKEYEMEGVADSAMVYREDNKRFNKPDDPAVSPLGYDSTMFQHRRKRSGSAIQLLADPQGSKRGSAQDSERESFHSAREVPPSRSSINSGSHPSTPVPPGPEIAAAARALAAHRLSRPQSRGGRAGTHEGSLEAVEEPETDDNEEEETCPICLLDFEDGDDVRVLPCQQAHSYHQACIDPWLLEVSPSCPLCRRDFSAVAPMNSESQQGESSTMGRNRTTSDTGRAMDGFPTSSPPETVPTTTARSAGHRFGRYLAFVRSERRRSADVTVVEGDEVLGGGVLDLGNAAADRRRRRLDEQHGPGPY